MTYVPKVYKTDGGDKLVVASGGTLEAESGSTVKMISSAWQIDGVAVTASAASLNAAGGSVTSIDIGADGTAGTVDIFPTTAANGKMIWTATDMGGAWNLSITNDAIAAARAYTIPDAGGDGQFVMTTEANQLLFDVNTADRTFALNGNVSLGGATTTAGTFDTAADLAFTGAFAATIAVPSASTWTLPTGGGTLATTSGAETGTTAQTFTVDSDNVTGTFILSNTQAGTDNSVTLQTSTTTQDVVLTLPDVASDTIVTKTSTDTLTNKTLTAPVVNGMTTAVAAGNFDLETSTGTFKTPSGQATLYGSVDANAGAKTFDLTNWSGAFTTSTGTNTLSGNVVIAGTKTFGTGTGTVSLNGTVALAASKNAACAAGTTEIDWSLGTGAFQSTTGANTLNGAVSIADATTPSLTCATGKTNTGFVSVLGKTSGGIKVLPIDAGTSLLTISQEAQTQTCTMKIPDLNVATGQFVCNNADQTVEFVSGASDRTVTLAGDITTAGAFLTSGAFSCTLTTTASTDVTLPTTGTLATLAGAETLTNKVIDGDDNTLQDIGPNVSKSGVVGVRGGATPVAGTTFAVNFDMDNTAGVSTWTNNLTPARSCKVLRAWAVKTDDAGGGASDTVQIGGSAGAITDAATCNVADLAVIDFATFDDSKTTITNTATLTCTTVKGTSHVMCEATVLLMWL